MRERAERAYFRLCRALGGVLRRARYSSVRVVGHGDAREVRKRRRFYAPLLVRLGEPLVRALDTGVRVLPQREWEARERRVWRELYGLDVRVEPGGMLALPCLPGRTLAELLEDETLPDAARWRATQLAARALADFHRAGLTHGDAMAENVMVDLEGGAARWFDFETEHHERRPLAWRRADDVRALLATSLFVSPAPEWPNTLRRILDTYRDPETTRLLPGFFASVWRRPLAFHLGQAGFTLSGFRRIRRLLGEASTGPERPGGARRGR